MLEMVMPTSFFDVMTHIVIFLFDELDLLVSSTFDGCIASNELTKLHEVAQGMRGKKLCYGGINGIPH
jgi:hypothetical protein